MVAVRVDCLCAVLYTGSLILSLIGSAFGEPFHRARNHEDQERYEESTEVFEVKSKNDAEDQLEKYGYLNCIPHRQFYRRSADNFISGLVVEEHGAREQHDADLIKDCTYADITQGIRKYQRRNGLPETGSLDNTTAAFMGKLRCGNKDDESTEEEEHRKKREQRRIEEDELHRVRRDTEKKLLRRLWRRTPSQSNLFKVLITPKSVSGSGLKRRMQYLHERAETLKREDPLGIREYINRKRRKRSIMITSNMDEGEVFSKSEITWRLLNQGFSSQMSIEDQRSILHLAFRMWCEVIPLEFFEDQTSDIKNVDIEIAFGKGTHLGCPHQFDGHGGEVAHSWHVGNMHFDDEEHYKQSRVSSSDGLYLLRVAVHEIGHVLGLVHVEQQWSIMHAVHAMKSSPDFELGWEDRKIVQGIYGVCKGRFDAIFDWVRREKETSRFIFNTYFFRDEHYWMYENHANRTRYGDPLTVVTGWRGVPSHPDAYTQKFYMSVDRELVNEPYFFKGDMYYHFNSTGDSVFPGWPNLIADDFPARNASSPRIPDNIDTVYFDIRDKNFYFFKGSTVYVYDARKPEADQPPRGCCEAVKPIREVFPTAAGSLPLPDHLDVVYYSYKDQMVYFIKGEDVWKNVLYHPKQKIVQNMVTYIGKWYDKWYDICDVARAA